MKQSIRIIASLFAAAATVAPIGCSYSTQRTPGMALHGLSLERLCRQDYEVLGNSEGTATQKRIIGFRLPFWNRKFGYAGSFLELGTVTDAAFYEAQRKAPEADAFLPTSSTVSTTGLPGFLGAIYSVQDATVKGKAIRLKTGDGSNCATDTVTIRVN